MFEKKYKDEDVKSAHDKQKRLAKGQGGVIFTAEEREILDNHVRLPEKKEDK